MNLNGSFRAWPNSYAHFIHITTKSVADTAAFTINPNPTTLSAYFGSTRLIDSYPTVSNCSPHAICLFLFLVASNTY